MGQFEHQFAITGDGYTISYDITGPVSGEPVLLMPGTPGGCIGPKPRPKQLHYYDVRLLSYDRPGYGESTRRVGRCAVDSAADYVTVLDNAGVEQATIVSRSGGSLHALACAAMAPERVKKVKLLAPAIPQGLPGVDYQIQDLASSNRKPTVVTSESTELDDVRVHENIRWRAIRLKRDPHALLRELAPELRASDERVISSIRSPLLTGYEHGVQTGPFGWVDDILAVRHDLGFRLEDIQTPIEVHYFSDDQFTPMHFVEGLMRHLPQERLRHVRWSGAHFSSFLIMADIIYGKQLP